MLLSVIIPTYNYGVINEERLLLTLAGYMNQTLQNEQFEILVVDDGSQYDISGSVAQYFGEHSPIRVLQKQHSGFCSTVNWGVRQSTARHVLIATDDNVPAGDALEKMLAAMEMQTDPDCIGMMGQEKWLDAFYDIEKPFCGKLFAGVGSIRETAFSAAFPTVTPQTMISCFDRLADFAKVPGNYEEISRILSKKGHPAQWLCVRPGALLVNRAAYLAIGGFDEAFDPSGWYSDIEWGYRVSKQQAEIYSCPESVFIHLPHHKFYDDTQEQDCYRHLFTVHPDPYVALLPFLWGRPYEAFMCTAQAVLQDLFQCSPQLLSTSFLDSKETRDNRYPVQYGKSRIQHGTCASGDDL